MNRTFCSTRIWLALVASPALAQNLNDFFDSTVLQEVRVSIAQADWLKLHEQYLEDTYYRCDFEWRGIRLTNVGVRSRGSGSRSPIKPNFGFDFSRYDSKQRFLTLKSVVTRNFAQDPSMVREFLSLRMFARMGLPYERESFAKILVNGEYAGLYLLVEPLDKRFLLSHFGEDTGYLYEGHSSGTPYGFQYLGPDAQNYLPDLFEPKTNEDAPDADRLIAMIRAINETPDAEFVEAVSRYLDIDQFIAHMALEQFLAEDDGLLGYGGMTNYYLYRRTADNRFTVLVWDKDNAFVGPSRSLWQNSDRNILAKRALANPALRQRFLQMAMHAAETAGGAGGWLASERQRIYLLIREAALSDPVRVCLDDTGIVKCAGPEFETHHQYLSQFPADRLNFVLDEIRQAGLVTDSAAPALRSGAAVNLASSNIALSPGSLARISMDSSPVKAAWADRVPLPEDLDGLRVLLAGKPVPLVMSSTSDIVFQVPWDIVCGAQTLQVIWQGHADHAIDVEVRPALPAVMTALHADWTAIGPSAPARPGEILVLFGTGLSWPTVKQKTGAPAPLNEIVPFSQSTTAWLGDAAARVLFSGLAPGLIGVAQLVVEVPPSLPSAGRLPLVIIADGEPGTPYMLDVIR